MVSGVLSHTRSLTKERYRSAMVAADGALP